MQRYTVTAPDDGWRYRPKHVEKFPDKKINKLCNLASCWIYIRIFCSILHIRSLQGKDII